MTSLSLLLPLTFLFGLSSSGLHLLSRLFNTFAFHVYSTTFIAEFKLTLTGHVITTLVLLDPKFALWALFEFFAFDKSYKFLIILTSSCWNRILFASHAFVPLNPAVKTILFFALGTLKSLIVFFLEKEHITTAGCRTPWSKWRKIYIESPWSSA